MRRRVLPAILIVMGAALAAQAPPRADASLFLADVKWLSSDDLSGRGNGTEALDRAAQYLRDRFRDFGLEEIDQPFESEVPIDPPANAALVIDDHGRRRTLVLGRDYYPLSILDRTPAAPPPAVADIPIVFAGYGISAPALKYDDFAGVEVRDRAGPGADPLSRRSTTQPASSTGRTSRRVRRLRRRLAKPASGGRGS